MLWTGLLSEAGHQHCVRTCDSEAYALRRIEREGLAFLATTLPAFERDLMVAISECQVAPDHFVGFRRRRGSALPVFLGEFLELLFDHSGELRWYVDYASVIRTLRQVLLFTSKIEVDPHPKRVKAALESYVSTDRLVGEIEIPESLLSEFKTWVNHHLGDFLTTVESRIYNRDWTPRHSSGALATRESYNSRFAFATWTERLQGVLPWWEDMGIGVREHLDSDGPTVLTSEQETPSRVTTVPKTLKGPRIIAMEPVWNQFVQQGVMAVMSETLNLPRFSGLRARCGWMDQEPNQRLARSGSCSGKYATLDLSEASDRVSLVLVEALLHRHPFLKKVVLASRSQVAELPDGERIVLNKFASMGSALTFPIESLIFQVISMMAVARTFDVKVESDLSWTWGHEFPLQRVYGDDLIVPTPAARDLVELLEAFGLKVNARKSFTTGFFRESCGSDWFMNHDVSVFRMRHELPTSKRQLTALVKAIHLHNRALSAGWEETAQAIEEHLIGVFGALPYAPVGSSVTALWTWDDEKVRYRTNPHLHTPQVRALVLKENKPVDKLDGYGALRKFFTPHGDEPREVGHLERDGRSRLVSARVGWVELS